MKPITFPEVNTVFAVDQPEYQPLPSHKNSVGDVTTCWELTDEEIEKLKETKCIYLSVKTFNKLLQPQLLSLDKEEVIFLEECIGCSKKFDFETMQQDNSSENYCEDCWEHFKPIFKAEYEEIKSKGEID